MQKIDTHEVAIAKELKLCQHEKILAGDGLAQMDPHGRQADSTLSRCVNVFEMEDKIYAAL